MYDEVPEQTTLGQRARIAAEEKHASDLVNRTRQQYNACSTEGLRSRAMRQAQQSASDAARHERLAEKLTPEIEQVLWCWQECLALGLIDPRVLTDALQREEQRRRDRY